MTYSCGIYSNAVTGTGGSFTCASGSTVTFTIGGITICKAPVQTVMTPVSCAQATSASANASTPSVYEVAQLLLSINTTPATPPTTITITSAELTAAASLSLDFTMATQMQLQTAVQTITNNPAAILVSITTAQNELAITVVGAAAGNYSGTFMSTNPVGVSGTWTLTIAADGTVAGTATVTSMGGTGGGAIAGSLTSGTMYAGTAGSSATWTGTLDTSKSPNVFSGTWTAGTTTGTFTGTKM